MLTLLHISFHLIPSQKQEVMALRAHQSVRQIIQICIHLSDGDKQKPTFLIVALTFKVYELWRLKYLQQPGPQTLRTVKYLPTQDSESLNHCSLYFY